MPVTAVTFGLGYLAIIGLPPFAGFFSKDKIIESAYGEGGVDGWILGSVALLGAGITAFYMTRVMVMTFFGPRRWSDDVHPHESPPVMTGPMVLLPSARCSRLRCDPRDRCRTSSSRSSASRTRRACTRSSPDVLIASRCLVALGGRGVRCSTPPRRPVRAPTAVPPRRRGPARPVPGRPQRGGVHAPGQYLTGSLVFADNRGVDGASTASPRWSRGTSARVPADADRPRPLVRPVDARRRHRRRGALLLVRL
jgi:NADH-quinone oxidoreductase subunit L